MGERLSAGRKADKRARIFRKTLTKTIYIDILPCPTTRSGLHVALPTGTTRTMAATSSFSPSSRSSPSATVETNRTPIPAKGRAGGRID